MNPTATAARRRQIAAEAETVVNSKAYGNNSERLAALDALAAEVKSLDAHDLINAKAAGVAQYVSEDGIKAKTSTSFAPLALAADQSAALLDAARNRQPISIKASTTSNVAPANSPVSVMPPIGAPRDPQRVLSLLPSTPSSAGVIEYFTTSGTAAAAAVAEGALKPESALIYNRVTTSHTKVAHFIVVTDEALSDMASFQNLAQADLIAGVIDAESGILLNAIAGTPAAQTFNGMFKAPGTQSYTRTSGDTILDALEIASTGLRNAGRFTTADGIIMNPMDFSKARRVKDSTGAYLAGNPTQSPAGTLWGLPVAQSSKVPLGKALIGNFSEAVQVWVREGISIRVDPYSRSTSNQVVLIAEERLSLGVLSPSALSVVTISDPA